MIETYCRCLTPVLAEETAVGTVAACPKCKADILLIAGEFIAEGTALGDFDARLVITKGPKSVGQVMALGGLPDLQIGKSADRHIHLPGMSVSRAHAKLTRLDFGPSRWQISDTQSRNGLFVNDEHVSQAELRDGDLICIGEFELQYLTKIPKRVVPTPSVEERVCPGCKEIYSKKTQLCVACGINLKTGRPMVTSRDLDENDLAIRAHNWVRFVSWILRFGLFPVASEAFGTKKPISIRWIAGITVVASILFFIPYYSQGVFGPDARPWMMWVGKPTSAVIVENLPPPRTPYEILERKAEEINRLNRPRVERGEFQFYQLFTNILIHGGVLHLAGNMVFMLVFGIRVNELIGNLKMAIIYPVLGVCADLIFMYSARNSPLIPSLGASGAIMGLAGMYFVFFPVQKVHMIIWLRAGLFTGWRVRYKLFRMSGFWLLVLWVGLNDVLPTLLQGSGTHGGGVAHWAHLGGFISGFAIAVGLLVTRQVNAHGSDLLSMIFGPMAWKILGRPGLQPA